VYEWIAYNNVFGGVSLSGGHHSDENPLYSNGKLHRWEWHTCLCCPLTLLKQENWFEIRKWLDADVGRAWVHRLYRAIGSNEKTLHPAQRWDEYRKGEPHEQHDDRPPFYRWWKNRIH
jgi:hypothetical protein